MLEVIFVRAPGDKAGRVGRVGQVSLVTRVGPRAVQGRQVGQMSELIGRGLAYLVHPRAVWRTRGRAARTFLAAAWTSVALLAVGGPLMPRILRLCPRAGQRTATPLPLPADKTALNATVHFDGHEFHVTNTGNEPWTSVMFTIVADRAYVFEPTSVAPHQRVAVGARSFATLRGNERFQPGTHSFLTFGISATLPDGQEGLCLIGGPSL